MKSIFSAFLLLAIGSAANAIPKLPVEFADHPGHVRNAKVHVQAVKTFKKKMPDGSYQTTVEKICDANGEVPVLDDSAQGPTNDKMPDAIICKTNLNIGPANVIMTGVVGLLHNVDPMDEGQKNNYRYFGESVWVQSGANIKVMPFATAMIPDLNVNTLVMTATGDQFGADQPDGAVLDEKISVFMKIEDK